ncbi:MAG: aldehyde dehydrogenase family protein, partial [Sinobacterium sp.]|nr:aldehyde dehydrogenase family protein [Sinobacterium sp.]
MTSTHLTINWAEKAAHLSINTQAFINGEYTDAKAGQSFECISPANGKKIADVTRCQDQDLALAVHAARESFESGVWANKSNGARKAIMLKVAEFIKRDRAEFALLESLDMGKNIRDSFNLDVSRAAEAFEWYGEAIDKV